MLAILVLVCVCAGQRISLFWRETHTKGLRARSPARPEVDEGKKVPEKTERASWQRKAEETSRLESAVKRRRRTQSIEVSIASGFCGSFARVHARVNSQIAQKVLHRLPPLLTFGADPSPCLIVCSSLQPSRLCFVWLERNVYCPWSETTRRIMAMSSLV